MHTPDAYHRVGAALLGSLAGVVASLFVAAAFFYAGAAMPIASIIGSGAVAGGLAGLLLPDAAMHFAEGVCHFVIGFFSVDSGILPENPDREIPKAIRPAGRWTLWAFTFGVILAVLLVFISYF